MHYRQYAFSKNRKPTILPKRPVPYLRCRGLDCPSELDIEKINFLYKCYKNGAYGDDNNNSNNNFENNYISGDMHNQVDDELFGTNPIYFDYEPRHRYHHGHGHQQYHSNHYQHYHHNAPNQHFGSSFENDNEKHYLNIKLSPNKNGPIIPARHRNIRHLLLDSKRKLPFYFTSKSSPNNLVFSMIFPTRMII